MKKYKYWTIVENKAKLSFMSLKNHRDAQVSVISKHAIISNMKISPIAEEDYTVSLFPEELIELAEIVKEFTVEHIEKDNHWTVFDKTMKRFKKLYGKSSGAITQDEDGDILLWDAKNFVLRYASNFKELSFIKKDRYE